MSRYRRTHTPGACYFFTLVTYRRQRFLCDDDVRLALRESIEKVRQQRPFTIDAWVLLPDHLHCIWTLPDGDADFPLRWNLIKRYVTRACGSRLHRAEWMNASKQRHRESTLWQRRYWEHQIRDDEDYATHMDYVHYNPVKHALCRYPTEWPYTSFHRLIRAGVYPRQWGEDEPIVFPSGLERGDV